MSQRTCKFCDVDISERPGQAKYCGKSCRDRDSRLRDPSAHKRHQAKYRASVKGKRMRRLEYVERDCIECGATWRTPRRNAKLCSDSCRSANYSRRMKKHSKLPADHPVVVLIAEARERERIERERRKAERRASAYAWRTARTCPGCACQFTPIYTPSAVTCSARCARRVSKQRRRAREHGSTGEFTWSEFMRIARRFDYCCAYCGTRPDRLDPDHVIPLSRGGSNTPSNLLPSCLLCNSSKCAMTLPEWATWRADRGLEPRVTSWTTGDPRFLHLTDALLLAA